MKVENAIKTTFDIETTYISNEKLQTQLILKIIFYIVISYFKPLLIAQVYRANVDNKIEESSNL